MISVMCACGKRLKTEDRHAGKRTRCPNCGAEAIFPIPEPAAVGAVEREVASVVLDGFSSGAPAGPRVVPMPRRTLGGELQAVVFIFLALASFWAGFASIGQARYFDAESTTAGHRFKDDNAVGATANAVEHLAKTPPSHSAAPWFIAGLLCVLIVKLDGLRWTIAQQT